MLYRIFGKTTGIFVLFLLFPLNPSSADEMERLFTEGNTLYQEGKYREALEFYKKIIDSGYESGPAYYNMGNCYYKIQETGKAILHYERARKLIPGDEDLKANLALANLTVIDKIEARSGFLLFRIVRGLTHLLPTSILVWVVGGTYLGCILFLIVWIVSRKRFLRVVCYRAGLFFGILFLVFGLSLIHQLHEEHQRIEGIILTDKVDVMSAPSVDEGMEVFSLHEGTKVRIDQRSRDWVEIILADGKVGWVKQDVLEII